MYCKIKAKQRLMEEKNREKWGFNRSDVEIQNKFTVLTSAKLAASYVNELVEMFCESFHCN